MRFLFWPPPHVLTPAGTRAVEVNLSATKSSASPDLRVAFMAKTIAHCLKLPLGTLETLDYVEELGVLGK